jgi:hypothetical protein
MNCPSCQTANAPDAAFCGSCGTRLAPAEASATVPGSGQGYSSATGYGTPADYSTPSSPSGFSAPNDFSAPNSASNNYSAPNDFSAPNYGGQGGFGSNGTPNGSPGGSPMGQYKPGSVGALSSFKFDLSRLSLSDRVVGVATLIAMISIWLTWYTASVNGTQVGSASGTGYHGWLWLEFFIALAVVVYLVARAGFDELPVKVPVAHERLLIGATGLQLLLLIIAFFATPPVPSSADFSADGVTLPLSESFSVSWGVGAFIGLLAALVAAAPVIVPAVRSYLESRKAGGNAQRY